MRLRRRRQRTPALAFPVRKFRAAAFSALWVDLGLVRSLQQVRQLRDVCRDASGFVAREPFAHFAEVRIIIEVDVTESLPVGRRGQAADTQASGADVRDGDHRALPAAGELGRGGLDRDVSGRRLGSPGRGITEALWGTRVSPSTVSELNKKIYGTIEAWRNRPIDGEHPYVYLDGIVLKRCWAGEVRNVSLLVAIGVNSEGYREILGICEGAKEDKAGWSAFLKHLKSRGLKGVRLIISDACMGLSESAAEFFPDAAWQRCIVHWYRNVFSHVPSTKVREAAAMLKAIHAGEDIAAARQKAVQVIEKLRGLRLTTAAQLVEGAVEETLAYYAFPEEHWRRIRTNNPLERILREIRRRTRVVGAFPDGQSALNLAAARLRHIAGTAWSTKRYLNIELLKEQQMRGAITA